MSVATFTVSTAVQEFLDGPKRLLIDGEWVEAAGGETFETIDPATGAVLTTCASAQAEDVDRAVRAARRSLDGPWSRISPADRAKMLWRIGDLIERDAAAIAELETLDNGKPISHAFNDDLPETIEHFRYYAGWATKLDGDTIPVSAGSEFLNYTLREPIGVVGGIVPWNYPIMVAAMKLAPALACGNAVILKPAEQTPLTTIWLGRLLLEAGVPEGVVSILTGLGETAGAAIASHPGIDAVGFMGSTEVGRSIVQASAGNLKRVALELGGKSPNLVLADADLDEAIPGVADGIFYNMGQDCSAGSRVYVERPLYADLVDGLADKAQGQKLGNGLDKTVEQGPLVSATQMERVLGYLEAGREEGARVASGGERVAGEGFDDGYFVKPTVFSDASSDMKIAREEIFGPVVTVIPFTDVDEALREANATSYGLGAGIWTSSVSKAHRLANSLQAGNVWVNCYNVGDVHSPWGGFKESGYGHDRSRYALNNYTRLKSVWINHG